MAGDIYLFLDGIPGESTSVHFRNWIDVMSFSLGVTMEVDQDARNSASGGVTSGAADPEDISVDTKMSIASPILLQCCAAGAVIPRGRLIQCNIVGGKRVAVSDYAFGDSIISNVSLTASGGAIPDESISINYGSIIWRYHCFNHFNPTQKLATTNREWSIIRANTTDMSYNGTRDNALQALDIAPVVDVDTSETDKDGVAKDYFAFGSILSGPKINFKEGPIVFHPEEKDKNN